MGTLYKYCIFDKHIWCLHVTCIKWDEWTQHVRSHHPTYERSLAGLGRLPRAPPLSCNLLSYLRSSPSQVCGSHPCFFWFCVGTKHQIISYLVLPNCGRSLYSQCSTRLYLVDVCVRDSSVEMGGGNHSSFVSLLYSLLWNAGGIIYPFCCQWIAFRFLLLQNAAINIPELVSCYMKTNISYICTYAHISFRAWSCAHLSV